MFDTILSWISIALVFFGLGYVLGEWNYKKFVDKQLDKLEKQGGGVLRLNKRDMKTVYQKYEKKENK